ncbi:hypothetical protein FM110_01280 [Brachybacterium nesterenkovii]|uniref:Uncharacterized protein n=1 Tax=Brachybacterium nesterenkovii TaxID=47847 RepID=A0A1X6WTE7_9MICO|nr:hypothetical protein FM110_01280 [Brachybacterium nesterenkovii]
MAGQADSDGTWGLAGGHIGLLSTSGGTRPRCRPRSMPRASCAAAPRATGRSSVRPQAPAR